MRYSLYYGSVGPPAGHATMPGRMTSRRTLGKNCHPERAE